MTHPAATLWSSFIAQKVVDVELRMAQAKATKKSTKEATYQLAFLKKSTRIDTAIPGWKSFKKNNRTL